MSYYIGIDVGYAGAVVILDATGKLVKKDVTPLIKGDKPAYDLQSMIALLVAHKDDGIVGIEKQQSMPAQGVSSTFKLGRGYGLWEGIVATLGMPYELVHPKTWQKEILKDMDKSDTKQAGAVVCHRVFPKENFKASDRCKVDHIGVTDATCIALYVYHKNKGK
jgi:hypothetical protein